jgi:hypothetical protein
MRHGSTGGHHANHPSAECVDNKEQSPCLRGADHCPPSFISDIVHSGRNAARVLQGLLGLFWIDTVRIDMTDIGIIPIEHRNGHTYLRLTLFPSRSVAQLTTIWGLAQPGALPLARLRVVVVERLQPSARRGGFISQTC